MSESAQKEGHGNGGEKTHRRRKGDHGGSHEEAGMAHDESNWLVSYADMMTLLFGFFVLMYTFSRIDETKFEVVRKDVAKYFGGQVKIDPTVKKLEEEVSDVISSAGLDKSIKMVTRDSELELRFQGNLHFVAGTATLSKDSAFVLEKLIDTVKRTVKADAVSVEGHTDDNPINSPNFPSNWELSSSRADTVIREFEKYGFDPSKLTTKGFGSSRPLLPNRDSTGNPLAANQELNRRVIVIIGFKHEMEDAIKAMKSGKFVSADTPELSQDKINAMLVHEGEGAPTWREKVNQDTNAIQEKLKLAEERLKEEEAKKASARKLSDLQNHLMQIEKRIDVTEQETKHLNSATITPGVAPGPNRVPATQKSPRKKAPVGN